MIESSKLVIPQRKVPVTPFHIGVGALEHLSALRCLCVQLPLLSQAQWTSNPIGGKQWGTETLSTRTKWRAFGHRPRRGHALKVIRRNEMGVHGVGRRRRQVQVTHLLPPLV